MGSTIRPIRNVILATGLLIAFASSAVADLSRLSVSDDTNGLYSSNRVTSSLTSTSRMFKYSYQNIAMRPPLPTGSRHLHTSLLGTKFNEVPNLNVLSEQDFITTNSDGTSMPTGSMNSFDFVNPPAQDLLGPPSNRLIVFKAGSRSMSVAFLGDFQITEPEASLVLVPTPEAGLLGMIGLSGIAWLRRRSS